MSISSRFTLFYLSINSKKIELVHMSTWSVSSLCIFFELAMERPKKVRSGYQKKRAKVFHGHKAPGHLRCYLAEAWGMEAEGAMRIWKRSVEKYRLRYTSMIADGDSSTYHTISEALPYGVNHPISKHECVGHVQKRMFNHLESLKKQRHCDQDGKVIRLGGRGRLTKDLMLQFQRWYGKAIRSNVGDAEAMKKAVMAIYYHSISTNLNPQHDNCPMGLRSWCQHRRAESRGEPYPDHHTTISEQIAPIVKKAFVDLSKDSLMQRCVLGATQNQNESFNSIIWSRCPKTDFYSNEVVEMAAHLAVITFNSGRGALKQVLERLHLHLYGFSVQ